MTDLRMKRALAGAEGVQVSTGRVYAFPTHSHAYYETVLYPAFDGRVWVNDTCIVASVPFAVLMTPTDLHRVETDSETAAEFIKLAFTEEVAGKVVLDRLTGAVFAPAADTPAIPALFRQLTADRPAAEQAVILRALLLLTAENGRALPSLPVAGTGAMVTRATAMIADEFQTDLTLADLARRLNVSYQHLSASFSKHLGLPFSAYLTDVRLRHAAAMLKNSAQSVTEIAMECGYRNLSHFLSSFTKKYGMTPKEYRNALPPDPHTPAWLRKARS